MYDYKGKVALVTGAAMGLGKAIVELLLEKGCKVALLDIDERQGLKTLSEFQSAYGKDTCVFYKCDVTNDAQLEDFFGKTRSKFGGLDIVVNNAGVAGETNWRRTFAINTEAVFSGILLGIKYMGKDRGYLGGHIINVASIAGIHVYPPLPAYNSSKVAVVAMTRCFGSDLYLERHGIKVTCLCPEPIETGLWTDLSDHMKDKSDTEAMGKEYDQRIQQPQDVARGVLMLIDDGKNGAALKSLHDQGLTYHTFKEQ